MIVGVSTSTEGEYLKRSYSDHELDTARAEFYTAVGPDGKNIILRKYLQDQADITDGPNSDMRIGFVSQALGHLQQEYDSQHHDEDPVHYYQQQREILRGGDRSHRSSLEYQDMRPPESERYHRDYDRYQGYDYYDVDTDYRHRSGLGVEQKLSNGSTSRSPKHKIRTPIIEETESTVERELMSRDQSRRFRRSDSAQELSTYGDQLNLSLSESRYDGPEPQYAETKSSILRRRHSNAKLSNNSQNSGHSQSVFDRLYRRKRRVNSMSDLPSGRNYPSNLRRRNSLSYEDLRYDELNQSRSTTLSTKKFSMYTGLSPKEKIEYKDYNEIR